jgi:hypothetical protein
MVINFWVMGAIFTDGPDNRLITTRVEDHGWRKPPGRRRCDQLTTGGLRPHHLRCRPIHASARRGAPGRDADPLSPAHRYPLAGVRHWINPDDRPREPRVDHCAGLELSGDDRSVNRHPPAETRSGHAQCRVDEWVRGRVGRGGRYPAWGAAGGRVGGAVRVEGTRRVASTTEGSAASAGVRTGAGPGRVRRHSPGR